MPDPIWRRIAEDLRVKIENGELGSSGQPLPSELELRAEYKASRNTVRDAVKWLMSRGLVETRPGQGTYVVQAIDPFVTSLTAEQSPVVSHTNWYDTGEPYQKIDPKGLETLLADALAVVNNLDDEPPVQEAGQRDRMLELLLLLANVHEYVAHQNIRPVHLA